jgi:hypothetical protein
MQHDERQQPADDDGDAGDLPLIDHFAQQQERPHDREGGLRHLRDRDGADLIVFCASTSRP